MSGVSNDSAATLEYETEIAISANQRGGGGNGGARKSSTILLSVTAATGGGSVSPSYPHSSIRCNQETSRRIQQKRVIKMLFVVVLEFFLCWTPLHAINTLSLFYPKLVYVDIGYRWLSFFQLLAFMSSCVNPITYCFMNRNFRRSFLDLFKCNRALSERGRMAAAFNGGATDDTNHTRHV